MEIELVRPTATAAGGKFGLWLGEAEWPAVRRLSAATSVITPVRCARGFADDRGRVVFAVVGAGPRGRRGRGHRRGAVGWVRPASNADDKPGAVVIPRTPVSQEAWNGDIARPNGRGGKRRAGVRAVRAPIALALLARCPGKLRGGVSIRLPPRAGP